MARIRTDRSLRRRPQPSRGDDLMSALPDDLLHLVLRRLDTRTALSTALLSTRWARLHRELSVLDFRVGSMLPPRYNRLVLLLDDMDIKGAYLRFKKRSELIPKIRRYERGAMRALSRSVDSFLDDEVVRGARRSVSMLRLEFFITHNPGCMNRLIAKSIDDWGVSDLEAVAKPIYFQDSLHTFPSHGLCHDPRASCLRSLKLGGCALPPLHEFSALTMLVLQDITGSTPRAAYEGVFTLCPQLQVLHFKSCQCPWEDTDLVVDAPSSQIRELVFDKCTLGRVRMRALPNLESLASRDTMLHFDQSASFPRLRQCNHTTMVDLVLVRGRPREYIGHRRELGSFLGRTPYITNLVLRFTGPRRWIVPPPSGSSSPLLPELRKLLVADVPSSWDVSWPRLLLEMAPSLETLHIHIAPCRERAGRVIPWEPTELRRRHLKELVVAGFQGTKRQICFVKFVVGVSTSLRHVALFRNGCAEERGQGALGLGDGNGAALMDQQAEERYATQESGTKPFGLTRVAQSPVSLPVSDPGANPSRRTPPPPILPSSPAAAGVRRPGKARVVSAAAGSSTPAREVGCAGQLHQAEEAGARRSDVWLSAGRRCSARHGGEVACARAAGARWRQVAA